MASLHLQVQGWILRAGLDQMTQIPQVSDGSISRWNCDQGKAKSQNILPESSQGKVMRSEDINIRTRSKTWTGDRESAGSASPEMSKGQTGILEGEGCHATQRLHSPPTLPHCVLLRVTMSRSLFHKSKTHQMAHMRCPAGRWQHKFLNSFCPPQNNIFCLHYFLFQTL